MSTGYPSYNSNDILCSCLKLKRQEVEVVAKRSKNFKHIVSSTGAGSVCTGCQPLIHEIMGKKLWIDVNIITIENISSNVKLFTFESKNTVFYNFRAGQYILVQGYINDRWEIRRYTLVSSEKDERHRKIMVKKEPYGLFSTWLHDDSIVNKDIRISQPQGIVNTTIKQKNTLVFIVAGIGITPAISFIKSIIDSKEETRFLHVIHSISDSKQYIYKEQLEKYANQHLTISIEFHLVSEKGLLNIKDISALTEQHVNSEFYLCGPSTFNQDIFNYLKESNIKKSNIHIDSFIMKAFEHVKPNKAYTFIGLVLLLAFIIQDVFTLKIPELERLQVDSDYRIYSGLFVLLFIAMQFIRSYNKASDTPRMAANTYQMHKRRAIFAPLIFFIHSSSFGVGYLFFLSLIYFSNFFVGVFNHELISDVKKRVRYYRIWLPLHILLSLFTLTMIALHIYVVGAY
jgi:ferredoxin-NADP reductase